LSKQIGEYINTIIKITEALLEANRDAAIEVNTEKTNIRVINSRRMRLTWHVARMGQMRNAHNILVGKCEGERPCGRLRRRWEDNIKMYVREMG
jgi:hypothetical protein